MDVTCFTPIHASFITNLLTQTRLSHSHHLILYYLLQYHKQTLAAGVGDIYKDLYHQVRMAQIIAHARKVKSVLYDSMYSIAAHYFSYLVMDAESMLLSCDRIDDKGYLYPPRLLLLEVGKDLNLADPCSDISVKDRLESLPIESLGKRDISLGICYNM